MKKLFVLFALLIFVYSGTIAANKGTHIKVRFKNMKNNECYLGFHYGNSKYIRDTAQIDSKGVADFSFKEALPGGIYLVVMPSHNYFEIIVTEPEISLETDTSDFVDHMKVISSAENEVFYAYLKFMKSEHNKRQELLQEKEKNKEKADDIDKQLKEISQNVNNFRKKIMADHPDMFWTKVLVAMEEPTPPEREENQPDSVYSAFLYGWYQNHFFDNIDFSDNRILRTPLYEAKIMMFMDKVTLRHPDSLKYAAARVIDKSMADTELFKFTLIKLFNKYAQSKYMGMDAVFVHLAERYYLNGKAYWADSAQTAKIWERVYKLSSNLIGMKAKNLIMKDTSGNYQSLYDIDAQYTVLIFWDHECGHCKKEIPVLKKYYNLTDRDSLQVYAVYIGTDLKGWKKYTRENNLRWINVADPANNTNFRVLYDVFSTPVVYLLNHNEVIEAKRIAVEDIEKIINALENKHVAKENDDKKEKSN